MTERDTAGGRETGSGQRGYCRFCVAGVHENCTTSACSCLCEPRSQGDDWQRYARAAWQVEDRLRKELDAARTERDEARASLNKSADSQAIVAAAKVASFEWTQNGCGGPLFAKAMGILDQRVREEAARCASDAGPEDDRCAKCSHPRLDHLKGKNCYTCPCREFVGQQEARRQRWERARAEWERIMGEPCDAEYPAEERESRRKYDAGDWKALYERATEDLAEFAAILGNANADVEISHKMVRELVAAASPKASPVYVRDPSGSGMLADVMECEPVPCTSEAQPRVPHDWEPAGTVVCRGCGGYRHLVWSTWCPGGRATGDARPWTPKAGDVVRERLTGVVREKVDGAEFYDIEWTEPEPDGRKWWNSRPADALVLVDERPRSEAAQPCKLHPGAAFGCNVCLLEFVQPVTAEDQPEAESTFRCCASCRGLSYPCKACQAVTARLNRERAWIDEAHPQAKATAESFARNKDAPNAGPTPIDLPLREVVPLSIDVPGAEALAFELLRELDWSHIEQPHTGSNLVRAAFAKLLDRHHQYGRCAKGTARSSSLVSDQAVARAILLSLNQAASTQQIAWLVTRFEAVRREAIEECAKAVALLVGGEPLDGAPILAAAVKAIRALRFTSEARKP